MGKWGYLVSCAILTAAALPPASASATVTCGNAGGILTVTATADEEVLDLERQGSDIEVIDTAGDEINCSGTQATVTNTDQVDIDDAGSGDVNGLTFNATGRFAPGVNAEAGGDPEIEISFDGNDGFDQVTVTDTTRLEYSLGALASPAGATGINTNASAEPNQLDGNDLAFEDFETLLVRGSSTGPVSMSSNGGPGFSGPVSGSAPSSNPFFLALVGSAGDDTLSAKDSSADTLLLDEGGSDSLSGGGGNDLMMLVGDGEPDAVAAEGGRDYCGFDFSAFDVEVNLDITVPQDTGTGNELLSGCEDLGGGTGRDTLTGTKGVNQICGDGCHFPSFPTDGFGNVIGPQLGDDDWIFGGGGGDTLSGGPRDDRIDAGKGKDFLFGDGGFDLLLAIDNKPDEEIDCGAGANAREKAKFDKKVDPSPVSC